MTSSALRIATANIIGYGTVGTMLDVVFGILWEVDHDLARELELVSNKVVEKYKDAEDEVWILTGEGG